MILYSIQPQSVVDICTKTEFITDITKSENNEKIFIDAYNWLGSKMKEKGIHHDDAKYPVWAWYKLRGRIGKPDFRWVDFKFESTEINYVLELGIPDDKVLLSDFDLWHWVLNKALIHDLNSTDSQYDKMEKYYDEIERTNPELYNKKLVNSWDNIFNLIPNKLSDCDDIQATFWSIKPEYIRKIYKLNTVKIITKE